VILSSNNTFQPCHDKLKVQLWEQERLWVKAQHSSREAVLRWINETSDKASHGED